MQSVFVNINFPEPKGASPTGVSFIRQAWIMHSEAQSTPVRLPPGQRATVTTFDPHKPIFPSQKDAACASAADRILSADTWIKVGIQVVCVYMCVLCKHQGSGAEEKKYI